MVYSSDSSLLSVSALNPKYPSDENPPTEPLLFPRSLDRRKFFRNLRLKVFATFIFVALVRFIGFLAIIRSTLRPNIRGDLGGCRKHTDPRCGRIHRPTPILDKLLQLPVSLSLLYRKSRPPAHSRPVLSRSRCRPKVGREH